MEQTIIDKPAASPYCGKIGSKSRFPAIILFFVFSSSLHSQTGYRENSDDPRGILLASILPDLRIFVDVEPENMPFQYDERMNVVRVDRKEIEDAVYCAIGNWKSVMPGINFRVVEREKEANCVLRFRDYRKYISGYSTAESFLPGAWNSDPDFTCGKTAEGKDNFGKFPDGTPCRELNENIMMFQLRIGFYYRKNFTSSLDRHEWGIAVTDRSNPRNAYFRRPDDPFWGKQENRTTCTNGTSADLIFDLTCPDGFAGDWIDLPHARDFGIEKGYVDLVWLIQHEFGHALLGGHTRSLTMPRYRNPGRDPIYDVRYAVRKAKYAPDASLRGITAPTSYSIMFSGNGIEPTWNARGIFDIDADRLASGNATENGKWKGYPAAGWEITYPSTAMLIIMQNEKTGELRRLKNWHEAHHLMEWPLHKDSDNHRAHDTEWFQVGIEPEGGW